MQSGWRLTQSGVGSYTIARPDGRAAQGLHNVQVDAGAAVCGRLRIDDGPALPVRDNGALILLPRGARTLTLDLDAPADIRGVVLRKTSILQLARAIARRKDIPRRRAMRALLSGRTALAVDILGAGALGATSDYHAWLDRYEPRNQSAAIAAHVAAWPAMPTFAVVMTAWNSSIPFLEAAVASVTAQHYPHWRLIIADDASDDPQVPATLARLAASDPRITVVRLPGNGGIAAATNAALARAEGDWIAFLDHDDMLSSDALALAADAVVRHPHARIIYTDEDKIDGAGVRADPFFKPDWNRELFYAQNYLNHLTLIRHDLVKAAGPLRSDRDGSQDYDLLLRCLALVGDGAIVHLPFVCYHWRFAAERRNYSMAHAERTRSAALAALDDHFTTLALPARAAPVAGTPYWRARWSLPDPPPRVTIIIPTRDRAALLRQAIDSILAARAAYPHLDILIADNDSADPDTRALFGELEGSGAARVIPAPGPFNFSAINNRAAAHARGDILGFVNNDVRVRNPDWLAEIVAHFARADVVAVGAKLHYADGRIQHAGIVTGIGGVAGHIWKRRDGGDRGPFSHLIVPREVTAATAACLFVRRAAFEAVGGFDETRLAVAFNDVDLCLRLRAAGGRIVWTPFAALDHFESASRGPETGAARTRFAAESAAMRGKWGAALDADPCYSPNLTLADESGRLAFPPRARRPWEA